MAKLKRLFERRLGIEGLELRALMAGDVTATVTAGVLEIIGDSKGNSVQIRQSGTEWRVQGISTTVNGSRSAQFFSGVTDITVNLQGGNDIVQVTDGTLTGALEIVDIAGAMNINLARLNANAIDILTFNQKDQVTITNCEVVGDVALVTFAGTGDALDQISVFNTQIGGSLGIAAGTGNDLVDVRNTSVGSNLTIDTSFTTAADSDIVNVSQSSSGGVFSVATGNGRDTIAIKNFTAGGNMTVTTSSNASDVNDLVNISSSSTGGSLTLSTGAGHDIVTITAFVAATDVTISTFYAAELGNNVLTVNNVTAGHDVTITTGAGSDVATLTQVIAANQLSVDMQAGNRDRLTVARSKALVALFTGGGNAGDILLETANEFGSETITGFATVV